MSRIPEPLPDQPLLPPQALPEDSSVTHELAGVAGLRSWQGVAIPPRLVRAGVLAAFILIAFLLTIAFVPWTQTITANGQLSAYSPFGRPQDLEAQIAARIKQWHVLEGETVRAGGLIVELEDVDPNFMAPDLLRLLEQSRKAVKATRQAALERAAQLTRRIEQLRAVGKAAVPSAEARVVEAENRVREAQQRVVAAKIANETAEINLRRNRQLAERGLVSQRDLELAVQAFVSSKAEIEAAEAALEQTRQAKLAFGFNRDQAGAEVGQRLTEVQAKKAAAMADAAKAEEQLASVELRLANAVQRRKASQVEAPIDGIIVRMARVGPGETVQPGDRLVRISPLHQDRAVELWARGVDAPLLTPGRTVRILFEGIPAIPVPAWPRLMTGTFGGIIKVVDQVDDGQGKYRFWVTPDPADRPWPEQSLVRQGTRARGWVILNRVPLWYEMWRRFNLFPPDYEQKDPSFLETILPKAGRKGK